MGEWFRGTGLKAQGDAILFFGTNKANSVGGGWTRIRILDEQSQLV
jgi:hypothetical protein